MEHFGDSVLLLLYCDQFPLIPINKPQKPLVLYDKPKAKSKTSKMGPISIKIQLYVEIHARKKYREDR